MDTTRKELESFIGRPASELPTPSLIISRPILEKNCTTLQENVRMAGVKFRAHVKALKVLYIIPLDW
jgi:D-serine ammonia-lyase